MPNVRTKIPVVEVIAPDGQKSLWVAAVAKAKAVEAVKQVIPANYWATLTSGLPFGIGIGSSKGRCQDVKAATIAVLLQKEGPPARRSRRS
jgi:hypothetical protein